jgi:hypothetical protein
VSGVTVKLLAYVSGALLVACLLLSAGWYVEDASHDRTKAQHQAANDRAAREFAEAARAQEQAWAERIAAADAKHQQELTDAKQAGERVADDLRSGALRLRREWSVCETGRLSNAAASAAKPDGGPADRNDLAGLVVRAGAECDAQIRGLQQVIRTLQR